MIVYHGTRYPDVVLRDGFQLPERYCRNLLGRGIYTSELPDQAARYGTVLVCELDDERYARIPDPYVLHAWGPNTEAEWLFHELAFRNGKLLTAETDCLTRLQAAKRLQEGMMSVGYAGIITQYRGGCVTYDLDTLQVRDVHADRRMRQYEGTEVWRVL